jgi:hypothetical protein
MRPEGSRTRASATEWSSSCLSFKGNLGKQKLSALSWQNGNLCYTIGSRRIEPGRRQASIEEKANVAEIDFTPSITTGDSGGNFFYLNRA